MEASSADAERLSYMTQNVHKEATNSVEFARQISEIDDELSAVVSEMFQGFRCSRYATTSNELQEVINKAKESHSQWLKGLEKKW